MVIDKPAGLLSQGEHTGEPNLVDWARGHVGRNYIGLIHRLDRNTSGIMILAKRSKSAQRLTEALQSGSLSRVYLAWLVDPSGKLNAPERWEHFLLKDERTNTTRAISKERAARTPGAKLSALRVTPKGHASFNGIRLTLAEFSLETGRSHQIRAQAAAEGFPLLGDTKYGGRAANFPRPALHSLRLSFDHPMSGDHLVFEAPLPEDMRSIQPFK